MTICRVDVSLVAAHHIGAHIWPPDGKNLCDDEDAEGFWFSPSLDGARALNDAEVSVLRRSRIELMHELSPSWDQVEGKAMTVTLINDQSTY